MLEAAVRTAELETADQQFCRPPDSNKQGDNQSWCAFEEFDQDKTRPDIDLDLSTRHSAPVNLSSSGRRGRGRKLAPLPVSPEPGTWSLS